jgi:hypothetical protein
VVILIAQTPHSILKDSVYETTSGKELSILDDQERRPSRAQEARDPQQSFIAMIYPTHSDWVVDSAAVGRTSES